MPNIKPRYGDAKLREWCIRTERSVVEVWFGRISYPATFWDAVDFCWRDRWLGDSNYYQGRGPSDGSLYVPEDGFDW